MKVTTKTPADPVKFTPKTLEITFESQEELDIATTALGNASAKLYDFYLTLRGIGGENNYL